MLIKLALWYLGWKMRRDPNYAWSWHCTIAMVAQDSANSAFRHILSNNIGWRKINKTSNERAADFMRTVFKVDTRRE
jgi:hypothetical protein